uniref:Uncharacterized protein n=1 Tax=Anopheles christyi TaxID=43041 RepID=A0A182KIM6_9DIPT
MDDTFPLVATGTCTQHERVAILEERCVGTTVYKFTLWERKQNFVP